MGWTYKEWYEKNRTEISKRRKQKYLDNAQYREEAKVRAMSYYMNNRKRHQPLDRQVIVSGGVEYITIGKLSELLGRSVQTIHGYHRSGVLPSPGAFDVRGWRLYTKEQAETIAQTFRLFDLGQIKSLQELAGEVRLRLTEIGSEVASG